MLHPSIRLEGSILSADILDAIERGERARGNRSVKNDTFEAKKPLYADCGLSVAEEISKHKGAGWMPHDARKKLDNNSKLITDYLFNS